MKRVGWVPRKRNPSFFLEKSEDCGDYPNRVVVWTSSPPHCYEHPAPRIRGARALWGIDHDALVLAAIKRPGRRRQRFRARTHPLLTRLSPEPMIVPD
jgi:hypothetical protein